MGLIKTLIFCFNPTGEFPAVGGEYRII